MVPGLGVGGFPSEFRGKESACNAGYAEDAISSLGGEDPLEEGMATTPKFLPGKSNGQRSLVGYSPLDHKESDMTEVTEHAGRHGTGRFFCAQKDSV